MVTIVQRNIARLICYRRSSLLLEALSSNKYFYIPPPRSFLFTASSEVHATLQLSATSRVNQTRLH